jgi:glycosyltransferase involved in cell wall biosynthesis
MRLLLVTGMLSKKIGSIEELVIGMGREAQRRQGKVGVVYYKNPDSPLYLERLAGVGIDLIILPDGQGYLAAFRYLISLIKLFRQWKPDVVQSFFARTRQIATLAASLCGVKKRFVTVWSPGTSRGLRFNLGFQFLSRYAPLVFGTKDTLDEYIQRGLPPEKARLIHLGVNLSKFDPARLDGSPFRLALGVSPSETLCSVIGDARFLPGQNTVAQLLAEDDKGLTFVIQAAAILKERGNPCHFVIAGGGPLMKHFKDLAIQLGVSNYLHFIGITDEIPLMLAASDIFITASAVDTFGLALLEAMSMRKPVVVCDAGGAREVVQNGKNGLLFPQRDIRALASCIERFVEDPSLRRELAVAGRALIEDQFNIENNAKDFLDMYESV